MSDPLIKTARVLRRKQTEDERKLWARLRDRRLNGLKFRRQAPCGSYVADFLCEAAQLVVELDGSHHGDLGQIARDSERTRCLNELGYHVVRIWNADLQSNVDGVLDEIVAAAALRLSPSSAPSGHLLPREKDVRIIFPLPERERMPGGQVRDLNSLWMNGAFAREF